MATSFSIKELEKKLKESQGTRWEARYRRMIYEKREENILKNIKRATERATGQARSYSSGTSAKEIKKDLDKLFRGYKKGEQSTSRAQAKREATRMGKTKRSYESELRYHARNSKVAEGLKNITKEQRQKAAQKGAQTRRERKEFKAWYSKLSHGEKIKYGKEQARIRREKRQEAYRKGQKTKEENKRKAAEEFLNKQIKKENENFEKSKDSKERERTTEGNNAGTDIDVLLEVYEKYGEFALNKIKNTNLVLKVIEKSTQVRRANLKESLHSKIENRLYESIRRSNLRGKWWKI